MDWKAWQGEMKAVTDGNGGFSGYASVFGIRDDGGDIVQPGAFTDALPDFLHHGFISDGHNWDSVSSGAIGTIVDAHEDDRGLWLRTEYHSTPAAQAARTIAQERLNRGKSVGLSIGYGVEPGGMDMGQDGTRYLLKLKLFEVSQVNVPMLRAAGLTGVKGFGLPFDDHSDNVRVAIAEWLERARSGLDVRLKEGRPLSEARRLRIEAVRDSLVSGVADIEALLKETEPKEDTESIESEPGEEPVATGEIAAVTIDPVLIGLRSRFLELDAMHRAVIR
jgi:HK97 family phage prohead protease